jgi:hypothetical protein
MGDNRMTPTLDSYLKVACEIWHYNQINEPIHFTKLISSLEKHMDKQTVSHALDTLEDWMIIYGEYGPTEKGRTGRVWFVDTHDGGDSRIRDLYEQIWKEERLK